MSWHVYILHCGDGSLYTGITNDLEARLLQHENGTGAKYTRGKAPFTIIYREQCRDRGEASRREAEIKGMERREKLDLCGMPDNN
ncbi:MAG: GIY-YIG nuclease family protein [Gammaproteobacteria bacterium]